jgi:hypothetical protein
VGDQGHRAQPGERPRPLAARAHRQRGGPGRAVVRLEFDRVWEAIKGWDLSRADGKRMYSGATGAMSGPSWRRHGAWTRREDREDAINDAVSDYRIALIDQAERVDALRAARDAAEAARDACESAEILLVQANERRAKAHKAFVRAVTGRDG